MKVIAVATLVDADRKSIPPGATLDLPAEEARSLVKRGLAALPPAKKAADELPSPVDKPADEPPPAE